MTHWKTFRHRLEALFCRALAWFIPKLPRRACAWLGSSLGSLAFTLDARGRSVAEANLICVYGEKYDAAARKRIARAVYRNFARTMLDLFWSPRLTQENMSQWVEIVGKDALEAKIDATGKGAIFMCVHQGNWEWAIVVAGLIGMPLMAVAEGFKNPRLTNIFTSLREISGSEVIPQENSLLRMLKRVKRNKLTAMLIDLNLRPSQQAASIVEAYGRPGLKMCVPLLHSVLAHRAGALLVPVETESLPGGRFRITAHPVVEYREGASIAEITQACWDAMEPIIHRRPEQYLWAYKHFRFQPKDAMRPYPPYAHTSGRFEKLQRELSAAASPAPVVNS